MLRPEKVKLKYHSFQIGELYKRGRNDDHDAHTAYLKDPKTVEMVARRINAWYVNDEGSTGRELNRGELAQAILEAICE